MARFWDIVWHAMLPVMIMVLFLDLHQLPADEK